MITNSDSYWRDKVFSDDKDQIKYYWLEKTFPRFYAGKYNLDVPDEEDNRVSFNWYNENDLTEIVNRWKGAVLGMKKLQEKLGAIGVNLQDVAETRTQIQEQIESLNEQIESLETIYPQKILEYTAMKQERRIIQPTIQKRVDEFASYNPMLKRTVTTFKEDTTRFVEVPMETLNIKPKKKIKEVIEEAVLVEPVNEEVEIVSEIDTTDLIENIKNGLLVRFNFGLKKGKAEVVDIFYENEEFVAYTIYEDSKGKIISEEETTLTENSVIEIYIEHFDKISEQFYDDGVEEVEEEIEQVPVAIEKPAIQSKSEVYKDAIGGYELLLDIETDENKIKLYKDIIEGYELLLGN
jgi:mRNA-degrading endonuclease RelE of RelBE toxin-antitoxin system